MKVALCCIGKLENAYIKEYVEYYKNIKFDKIYLYDNNDIDGENYDDVIKDYIENGFVDVINFRGKKICQLEAYEDCYAKHKNEYDWIAFFDCDEFMTFTEDKDVKEYLSRDIFQPYSMIHLNWMLYGDNDLTGRESDDRSVLTRFTEPLPYDVKGYDWCYKGYENDHIKTIVRGGSDLSWIHSWNPHTPKSVVKCCNNMGLTCDPQSPFLPYNFSLCYLRHYATKTITEWMEKMERGYCDQDDNLAKKHLTIERFFKLNKTNMDKIKIISE